jgi:hypothetical protein
MVLGKSKGLGVMSRPFFAPIGKNAISFLFVNKKTYFRFRTSYSMKPIFYLNEYRTVAFCASCTRQLRWLRGFSPPLIYDSNLYTKPLCFSGINCLQQTFGGGSFTIVLPFFCVVLSSVFSAYALSGSTYFFIGTPFFYFSPYIIAFIKALLISATNSNEMIFKIQLLNYSKKNHMVT